MMEVTIYTDGACRGNPGPGGWGSILMYTDPKGMIHTKEICEGYKLTTNNRMEILAAIKGLELLKVPCKVTLYSDSKYVVDAIDKGWVRKWKQFDWYKDAKHKEKAKNADLWQRLLRELSRHEVTFCWVKGHSVNPHNNRCDEIAVKAALDTANLKEDSGYESG